MSAAERTAAELSLIPEMMRRAMSGITPHMRESWQARHAASNLAMALQQAGAPLSLSAQAAVGRIVHGLVDEMETKAKFADRLGLVAYHFAKMITDADAIVIGPASPLGVALDILLPALEPAAQNELFDEAARKQALRLLRAAQTRGLFLYLDIEVRAA